MVCLPPFSLSSTNKVRVLHLNVLSLKECTHINSLYFTMILVTYSVDSIVGVVGIIIKMQLVKMVVMMNSENIG